MGSTIEEKKLQLDHERAEKHRDFWITDTLLEFHARGLILTSAMDKFNKFLNLPAGDKRASAFWEFAFNLLTIAVPALRLRAVVAGLQKSATTSFNMAKFYGESTRLAKVKKTVARGARIAGDKIDKGVAVINKAKDIKEKADKIVDPGKKVLSDLVKDAKLPDTAGSPSSELSKLDVSRKVILELVEDARKASDAWKIAYAAELVEYENRYVHDLPASNPAKKSQSLEDYMKEHLPNTPRLTSDELVECETMYLWCLIGGYVGAPAYHNPQGPSPNVKIVETTTKVHYHRPMGVEMQTFGPKLSIDGLNDTQQNEIKALFGPSIKRGKIFKSPPVTDVYKFLRDHKVKTEAITKNENSFSTGMKM